MAVSSKRKVRRAGSSGDDGVADKAAYLAELSRLMRIEWPKNRTISIVCHGHSVPAGYFRTPFVDTFNAYPHLLHRGLKERFPNAVINVIVTAIGGENSAAGSARFDKDVLSHSPDLVTIDYSLNDRSTDMARVREHWTSMVLSAKTRGTKVILLTPTLDTGVKLDDPNDPLSLHARQVRKLASDHGVGLVDSFQSFKDYVKGGGKLDDLMSQCNHPNRRGHEIVAARLMEWFPL